MGAGSKRASDLAPNRWASPHSSLPLIRDWLIATWLLKLIAAGEDDRIWSMVGDLWVSSNSIHFPLGRGSAICPPPQIKTCPKEPRMKMDRFPLSELQQLSLWSPGRSSPSAKVWLSIGYYGGSNWKQTLRSYKTDPHKSQPLNHIHVARSGGSDVSKQDICLCHFTLNYFLICLWVMKRFKLNVHYGKPAQVKQINEHRDWKRNVAQWFHKEIKTYLSLLFTQSSRFCLFFYFSFTKWLTLFYLTKEYLKMMRN